MPTEYQKFVSENIGRMPGHCTPCQKMKMVAEEWRKRKNGTKPAKKGRGATIMAPAGDDHHSGGSAAHDLEGSGVSEHEQDGGSMPKHGKLFRGGKRSAHHKGGSQVHFAGGSAFDSLRAANQGDPLMSGGNWKSDFKDGWRDFKYGFSLPFKAIGKVAKVAAPIIPLIV